MPTSHITRSNLVSVICDKIRGLFRRGKNSKDVELYLGKFVDDEQWQGYFDGEWGKAFLAFAERCLRESTVAADEYRRLRAMLDAAESFDADDR